MIKKKKCSRCLLDKSEIDYYKHKTNSDGLFPYCKECAKEASMKWKKDNPERTSEKNRKYREDNPEYFKERKRSHYENNKDKMMERLRLWQRNNKDRVKGYKLYRDAHKTHEITLNEWEDCKKYFNHRCAYCGIAIENHIVKFREKDINGDFHREHVDHEGANDLSNCVPSCKSCNGRKNNCEFEEWYNLENNRDYTESRYNKIIKWLDEDYEKYIK